MRAEETAQPLGQQDDEGAAPTVPSMSGTPPAIAAKTISKEMPTPDIAAGLKLRQILGIKRAAEGGETGRQRRDLELFAQYIDSGRLGSVLVLG